MRVLFTAHGAYGHIFPMIATAQALARAGHEVTVATAADLRPTVASLGLRALPCGIDDATMVAEARRRWPEIEHEPPISWAVRMFTDIAAPAMAADLASIIASLRPDLIVREEGEHGAPIAAAAAEISWLTHAWGSPRPPRSAREALATAVAPLWQAAGLAAPAAIDLDGLAVLDPCPPSLHGDEVRSRAWPIRPATPSLPTASDVRLAPAKRPLAYVGFGTVPLYQDRPALLTAIVIALLQRGFDAVVTTPDDLLAERLTSLAPHRVQVARWLSIPDTLKSCTLAVCHGGAGTVLAALATGIPLLLLPQGSPSQARMSDACQLRGVARVVQNAAANPLALDDALNALMTDDRFKATAQQLATEIAAMPSPDDTITTIHALDRA